jgi:hypothetical protein
LKHESGAIRYRCDPKDHRFDDNFRLALLGRLGVGLPGCFAFNGACFVGGVFSILFRTASRELSGAFVMAKPKKSKSEQLLALSEDFCEQLSFLIISWCNCESWFVRVFTELLKVDSARADLVYYSINSTRARIEMVQNLAILCMKDVRNVRHLLKLCREFKSVTELRNRLSHGEYEIALYRSAVTGIISANYKAGSFDGTNAFVYRKVDKAFINEVKQAGRRASSLSSRLARFVALMSGRVLKRPRRQPLPLNMLHKPRSPRPHHGKRSTPKRQPRASR